MADFIRGQWLDAIAAARTLARITAKIIMSAASVEFVATLEDTNAFRLIIMAFIERKLLGYCKATN